MLRWGIISTGGISQTFVKDILLDPISRGVTDVQHKVTAVGSRDAAKADAFIKATIGGPYSETTKGYGNYEGVYNDKNVDIVYVGTPHTSHYSNTRDALLAGKHVLCEKPFTSNAPELRSLIKIAKERNLFLMEAMWTRFQPIAHKIKEIIDSGILGDIKVMHADLSGDFDIENQPKTHRILDPDLGGGALLDLGPYPFVWVVIALFEHAENAGKRPSHIAGSMLKTPLTGVDSNTSFTLTFEKLQAQAILSCSINLPTSKPAMVFRFRKGNIIVEPPIYRPLSFKVQYTSPDSDEVAQEDTHNFSHIGRGHHYIADATARAIREGKTECDIWSLEKSLFQMEVFDEIRRQGGYKFPPGIEQVV